MEPSAARVAPVSWKKALRAVLRSGGKVISVSEQEIADAKAMIGRDGIGCEPGSATTVAGIKKLVAAGYIRADENRGRRADRPYAQGSGLRERVSSRNLAIDSGAKDGSGAPQPIHGAFQNSPQRVAANKAAILATLEQRR